MAEFSSWHDWISALPEVYGEGSSDPDIYLRRLREHVALAPDASASGDRHAVIRELNRRLRGLARVSYSGSTTRVAFNLIMATVSFAGALISDIAPAVALGGIAIALFELRIYVEDRRVRLAALAVEKLIDSLIERLESET